MILNFQDNIPGTMWPGILFYLLFIVKALKTVLKDQTVFSVGGQKMYQLNN